MRPLRNGTRRWSTRETRIVERLWVWQSSLSSRLLWRSSGQRWWHDWSVTVTGCGRVVTDVSNDDVRQYSMTTVSEPTYSTATYRRHPGRHTGCSVNVYVVNSAVESSTRPTDNSSRDRSSCWHSFQRVGSPVLRRSSPGYHRTCLRLPCPVFHL